MAGVRDLDGLPEPGSQVIRQPRQQRFKVSLVPRSPTCGLEQQDNLGREDGDP
jgi:hypothetical protein